MIKAKIDKDGYYISNYTPEHVQEGWIMVEAYDGNFINPKWDGNQWVEGASVQDVAQWKAAKIGSLKIDQYNELQPTDWYIIRQVDTGEPVPENIQQERASIRAKYDELINQLDK
jgi:hypothetical protein